MFKTVKEAFGFGKTADPMAVVQSDTPTVEEMDKVAGKYRQQAEHWRKARWQPTKHASGLLASVTNTPPPYARLSRSKPRHAQTSVERWRGSHEGLCLNTLTSPSSQPNQPPQRGNNAVPCWNPPRCGTAERIIQCRIRKYCPAKATPVRFAFTAHSSEAATSF